MSGTKGIHVDWEMKALLVVFHYALVKFLSKLISNYHLTLVCRIFFIIGHLTFLWSFVSVNKCILNDSRTSSAEKSFARDQTQSIFRTLCIRGVVILIIHLKSNLLPLLLVSVYMGFFRQIENGDYFYLFQENALNLVNTIFNC